MRLEKILPGTVHLIPQGMQMLRFMNIETMSVFFISLFLFFGIKSGPQCVQLISV